MRSNCTAFHPLVLAIMLPIAATDGCAPLEGEAALTPGDVDGGDGTQSDKALPPGSYCGLAKEYTSLTLSCSNGGKISGVRFASYGLPQGSCSDGLTTTACSAASSTKVVESACLGKTTCTVPASNSVFGDPCIGKVKALGVIYDCTGGGVGPSASCGTVGENRTLSLSCSGRGTISSINFASYGLPLGSCATGLQTNSACHATTSQRAVESACLGKTSCDVAASNGVFGDPCYRTYKTLAVSYACSGGGNGTPGGGETGNRYPIPSPLPDPEQTAPDTTKPVKVYILSGQSNMVGMGEVGPLGTPGTLETVVKSDKKFPNLVDASGAWTVRNDVWYKGVVSATANKWLTVGCGASSSIIGPELGFGHVMGYFHGEPVLIIKASQGNRSLAWDLLPPGSQRYTVDGRTYAGYRDGDDSWSATDPYKDIGTWYAGKQYDDFVAEIHKVLDSFGTTFPQYKSQGYEIAGFAWFQGHKDTGNAVHAGRYELNLVNFIKAFRAEFKAPKAPFVIATIGFDGWKMSGNTLTVANAQLAVSGEKGKYPDFVGNVLTVDTRDYWRDASISPKEQGYHYNRNAETYYLVGEALGRGMAKLRVGAR